MQINYFTDEFLKFEYDNNLNSIQIQGCNYWQYIRFNIFYAIFNSKNDMNVYRTESRKNFLNVLKLIPNMIIKNPILFLKKKDILVINCPRRIKVNETFDDIYTDYILQDIDKSYYVFEEDYFNMHYNPVVTKNLKYLDVLKFFVKLEKLKLRFIKKRILNEEEIDNIKKTVDLVNKKFDVKIDLDQIKSIIEYTILFNKRCKKIINKIFDKTNPKVLLLQEYYSPVHMSFIKVAKQRGIKVIELQHGAMGRYHIAYNYYTKININEFPDYIFTFGDYWSHASKFPINNSNITSTGFPYYEKLKKKYSKKEPNDKKNILFISDDSIGYKLSKLAASLNKIIDKSKYSIIYKLHPLEAKNWETNYPWLCESNIKVIDEPTVSIYGLFSISEIQVGVASTAIFEGLGYRLKTYIYNIEYHEYCMDLYNNGYAILVSNAEEIIEDLSGNSIINYDESFFWKENSIKNIQIGINNVINLD